MSDELTADELVKLAELCGHTATVAYVETNSGDPPLREVVEVTMAREQWQPHLDANQRDEVVQAIHKAGAEVTVDARHFGDGWHEGYYCQMQVTSTLVEEGWVSSEAGAEATPGLAVCRTALTAIER